MVKLFKNLLNKYKNSRFLFPLTVFSLLFLCASFLVLKAEFSTNIEFSSFSDGLWWTLITFSTTGYGDKVPVTAFGRFVTGFTILFGISATSFLSGTLASVFVERNTRARRGLMDFKKLKNHIIVCGWKDNMRDILTDIIDIGGGIESESIVVISNIEPDTFESLKETAGLAGLRFIRGDYFSEVTLKRAGIESARKVLVLADILESHAPSEVDSKTVMTVLAVKAMAKDVYVCAELLDRKYENYLKQAMCDEIIFIRDFDMHMLASSTATSGMAHIIYDIVSPEPGTSRIVTEDIPAEFINQSYGSFKDSFGQDEAHILLGLLENTGSAGKMKMAALREAQKTSDVSRLVSNLQKVKALEMNRPVMLPPSDYVIQNYSRAIVLTRGA